tara:strand:+ start:21638 stop:22675 length:1038 start_codon:yes stop_codon:yes gene_type:complete
MYLQSISSAFPEFTYTQEDCWNTIKESPLSSLLKPRSLTILEKILTGDSGIDERHFCLEKPEDVFLKDAGQLNQEFERFAPMISGNALNSALDQAGLPATAIDALFICTCTGYICPGITSHLAEQLGMRSDVYLQDLVGLGCGAAIPTLRSAEGYLSANPDATVAVIAVEICSAAFYMDNDPGVLISLCLFGDGASASIWRSRPSDDGPQHRLQNFQTVHKPEDREKIRFVNAEGKLKNKLDRSVPQLAAETVGELFRTASHNGDIDQILAHPGGRDVIEAIESTLPDYQLQESRHVLRNYGNLSSPSVLVALEHHLANGHPQDNLWLTSFGAGFACHSADFVRS